MKSHDHWHPAIVYVIDKLKQNLSRIAQRVEFKMSTTDFQSVFKAVWKQMIQNFPLSQSEVGTEEIVIPKDSFFLTIQKWSVRKAAKQKKGNDLMSLEIIPYLPLYKTKVIIKKQFLSRKTTISLRTNIDV